MAMVLTGWNEKTLKSQKPLPPMELTEPSFAT